MIPQDNGVRDIALALATSDHLAPIFAKMGAPAPGVLHLMESCDLDQTEATRIHQFFYATLRQMETNLRMEMTPDEIEQTLNTLRLQMRGPMGTWWEAGKAGFSAAFAETVETTISEIR